KEHFLVMLAGFLPNAAEALIQAAGAYDAPALVATLGPKSKDLVASEDPVRDKKPRSRVCSARERKTNDHSRPEEFEMGRAFRRERRLAVPIPIVKRNQKWYYDTEDDRRSCSGGSAKMNSTPFRSAAVSWTRKRNMPWSCT